ncbi:hypothetical protein CEW46_31230 [Bacillus cereus]|nr:hypothetical protein CEW46_31230 [Bacillus cereus]
MRVLDLSLAVIKLLQDNGFNRGKSVDATSLEFKLDKYLYSEQWTNKSRVIVVSYYEDHLPMFALWYDLSPVSDYAPVYELVDTLVKYSWIDRLYKD